jgi:hypothetical protein
MRIRCQRDFVGLGLARANEMRSIESVELRVCIRTCSVVLVRVHYIL